MSRSLIWRAFIVSLRAWFEELCCKLSVKQFIDTDAAGKTNLMWQYLVIVRDHSESMSYKIVDGRIETFAWLKCDMEGWLSENLKWIKDLTKQFLPAPHHYWYQQRLASTSTCKKKSVDGFKSKSVNGKVK